ncbi:DUF6731 family protein [Mesorhizobium sp. M0619]|uniref:DUF6731 family protein n=1 Tax=unclassified Mesorhizobium TaxID=325217 RepID=UPI00333D6203
MDRTVVARFYQVEPLEARDRTFFDCLQAIWRSADRDQWTEVATEIRIRLLRYQDAADNADFVEGEFIRQQRDNIPPIAPDIGPLEDQDRPLGHRCAFRYHPRSNVLLLESRREAITPGRINLLVSQKIRRHKGFHISPCLTQTALERLRGGTPRAIEFRVARPADMAIVEGDPLDIEGNLGRLANAFGGPNVEVRVSWPRGDQDGTLSRRGVQRMLRWSTNNRDHVEKLRIKILEEEQPIDVLSEQIKASRELDLPPIADANFEVRRSFLRQTFDAHFRTIERLYGNG